MLRKIRNKVILIFLFAHLSVVSQQGLVLNNYGISDGISQSSVLTITSDPLGKIWFGTQDGLNSFEGYQFEVFARDEIRNLKSSYIQCSNNDQRGNLWFGSKKDIILYRTKTASFSIYSLPEGTAPIQQIVTDSFNHVWLLTSGHELLHFNPYSCQFAQKKCVEKPKQLVQAEDNAYVLTDQNSLISLSAGTMGNALFVPPKTAINSVFYSEGMLYLFLPSSVLEYSFKTGRMKPVFTSWKDYPSQAVSGIVKTNYGFIIGTLYNGLYHISKNQNITHYSADFSRNNSLPSNNINSLYKDATGTVWIGTTKGLSAIGENTNALHSIGTSSNTLFGLTSENVWSFYAQKNALFIGTDLGISKYNSTTGQFTHYPFKGINKKAKDYTIMDIEPLDETHFFLTGFEGLFMFDSFRGTYTNLRSKNELLIDRHRKFYAAVRNKNELLIATAHGVLSYDTKTHSFREIHYLNNAVFRGFYVDHRGTIWTICDKLGLCTIDLTKKGGQIKPHEMNRFIQQFTSDHISTFIETEPGTFFLGTLGSGIIAVNIPQGTCFRITKKEGLNNECINGFLKDRKGNIWISTNRGIGCLSSKGKVYRSIALGQEVSQEYNLNAVFQNQKGDLYFGGIFGFIYFNESLLQQAPIVPYPKINAIKLKKNNKEWPKGMINAEDLKSMAYEIQLPYSGRDFDIWFQPNNLYNSKFIEYKCVIIGETVDTLYLGNTNHISFSALASGTYYIRLYARFGNNGSWSETPALLTVTIDPPFWRSPLFLWSSFLISLIGGLLIVRQRIRKERQEKVLLEVLVKERTREIEEQKNEIEQKNVVINAEKSTAEKWLNNALPEQAVKELQRLGKVRPKSYDSATILFTDVVGFSKISETMTPSRLVSKLDGLFKKFDAIVKERNVEKIKTIGDAYMAVGGIPEANTTHAIDVCLAALLIQDYMAKHKFDALANGKDYWEIRIGINTGPVTAGIIGKLKIAYDVWGSAVNQAQRMEQFAEPGTISISETTFRLIEPYFEVRPRGTAPMKSSLLINRYELLRIKPDLSLGGEGLIPNDLFYEISQLHLYSPIKYYSVETEVLRMLEEQLPQNLYYHSVKHTREVIQVVEHLALCEGVRDEGLFLLKTAALFHDLGFTQQYEHNESIGVELAQKILPDFGYSDLHIQTVSELIFATEVPHKPVNKLQEILCDADLGYLGTDDFEIISQKLKQELIEKGKIHSDKQWDEMQVPFLENHRYFTPTAIASLAPKKEENLAAVKNRLAANNYI